MQNFMSKCIATEKGRMLILKSDKKHISSKIYLLFHPRKARLVQTWNGSNQNDPYTFYGNILYFLKSSQNNLTIESSLYEKYLLVSISLMA